MKQITLLAFALSALAHAFDQPRAYLKAGMNAGSPRGIGLNSRAVVGFYNMDVGVNYGYYVNTVHAAAGLRLAIGERHEAFLNLGYDGLYSKNLNLNISRAWSLEAQHERRIGRTGLHTFASIGVAFFPEENEVSAIYSWPVVRVGLNKMVAGF